MQMKNVHPGKNYMQNILWKMWEIIEKNLVPKFTNLMTICGMFEAQPSTNFYKTPKKMLYIQNSKVNK